ncbi:MAG: TIGR04282 family arsenosugar biosynthesis glycosyltransferase [Alphaproteobacteria bacterium]
MRPRQHLVVFVRAPRVGAVKSRLAADIGALAAWRFYRDSMAAVLRRVARDRRWTCWLAVTPDRFARTGRFWPRCLPRIAQGPGDLGARMARPLARLPPGPVVVVGSDVPDICAQRVARAFRALARHDAVFGPATDGGYWLVGVRRRFLARGMFRDVRWSTRHALADTLANLRPGLRVGFVDELADVDDGADFSRWRRSKKARPIKRCRTASQTD